MLSLKHYEFVTKQNPVPYFFNQRPTMSDRLVTWSVQIDKFLSVTSCLCWQIWSGLGSGGKRWHHILLYMPNFECWSLSKHCLLSNVIDKCSKFSPRHVWKYGKILYFSWMHIYSKSLIEKFWIYKSDLVPHPPPLLDSAVQIKKEKNKKNPKKHWRNSTIKVKRLSPRHGLIKGVCCAPTSAMSRHTVSER